MARVSDRAARRHIEKALREIIESARLTAEARRLNMLSGFQRIAREFVAVMPNDGTPMTAASRARLRDAVRASLARVSGLYSAAGTDALEFADFVTRTLVTAHADVAVMRHGDSVRARATRDLEARAADVRARVEQHMASLRKGGVSVADLAQRYIDAASVSLDTILDAAQDAGIAMNDVTEDVARLLLGNDIDYEAYGLDRPDATPLRTLPVMGVAVGMSEVYNAMRGGESITLALLGLVTIGRWTLSDRHASLPSSPDVCDDLAARNVGHGPGWYLVAAWPPSPHPYCGCYMGSVSTGSASAWADQWV